MPALIEFDHYRSRRGLRLDLLGAWGDSIDRVETLTESELEARPVLAVTTGPSALIRGIGQYRPGLFGRATAQFTVEDSLDGDDVTREMIYRVADHARERGTRHLDITAAAESVLLAAIERSGFPCQHDEGTDRYALAI